MHVSRHVLLSVSIITTLALSAIFVAIPATPHVEAQAQLPKEQRNWEYVNHDTFATNYNPQTQINKDNVNLLELKWVYPIPPSNTANILSGAPLGEGSITPPLVVDGIVYILTNYLRLVAMDTDTGRLVWSYQAKANITEAKRNLPIGTVQGHAHAVYYINGWIVFPGLACDVIALDALTGKVVWTIEKTCADIPGNAGLYTGGYQSYPPMIYNKGNVLIYTPGVVDGATGRGFVAGYDMTPGPNFLKRKWITFTVPPAAPIGSPERNAWAQFLVDNCKRIWIQSISSCNIDQSLLRNDWGDMGLIDYTDPITGVTKKVTKSGTGTVWGQMSIDEETGYVYMSLSQPTIDWNGTYRPGPNLFSNSILAIDAKDGKLVWAHQSLTHDVWDWDCSWNTVLGRIGDRKVIFKNCKTGLLHAFDAATGELIWYFYPPNIKRNEWTPMHENSKLGGGNLGPKERSIIGGWDPRNPNTLTLPWMNYPSKDPIWQGGTAGSTDIAYDGKTIYTRAIQSWSYLRVGPAEPGVTGLGRISLPAPEPRPSNTTFYAVDAATGKVKWSFFLANSHRTGPTVSGGVLYLSGNDGQVYALDADTGKLLWTKSFGIGLSIPPTIGATAGGKMRMFQLIGGDRTTVGGTTGALMVWGLPDKLPEPQIITKEVVKEVPKEVVKEVVKEVPKEVIKEVVKEVPKEIIKEVPKEVIKEVTKTVTVETISPVSYAAIGIGVVLVVVAGVLFTRRKSA